jgi:predicted amidohydrolase
MADSIPVAAVQMCATDDLARNPRDLPRPSRPAPPTTARGSSCCRSASRSSAAAKATSSRWAETIDDAHPGPIVETLQSIATEHRAVVIGGGLPERVAGDDRRAYNTALVVGPGGELAARYRKIHLFDVDIPGGATLRESDATAPGNAGLVVRAFGLSLGVTICYDVRFPELYRRLWRAGADVLLVPAAFTAHTGAAHWHLLLRARAIENQAYVVAAAQTGQHNAQRASYGHAMVIDPWGTVLAEQAEGDGGRRGGDRSGADRAESAATCRARSTR